MNPARPAPPSLGPRGEGWVALQVLLLVALALTAFLAPGWPAPVRTAGLVVSLVAVVPGFALLVAGLRNLGGALTPYPKPMDGVAMTDAGIYGLVRHPIYGGGLLLCTGVALATSPWALAPVVALAVLFAAKSRREEAWLVQAYPGYEAYRSRVRRRFVPFVW